ncbi:hypothetical protein PCE1_001463 [Barthelona sp. PCE]
MRFLHCTTTNWGIVRAIVTEAFQNDFCAELFGQSYPIEEFVDAFVCLLMKNRTFDYIVDRFEDLFPSSSEYSCREFFELLQGHVNEEFAAVQEETEDKTEEQSTEERKSQLCRFFPFCNNASCKFEHPKIDCRYNGRCTNDKCNYFHTDKEDFVQSFNEDLNEEFKRKRKRRTSRF